MPPKDIRSFFGATPKAGTSPTNKSKVSPGNTQRKQLDNGGSTAAKAKATTPVAPSPKQTKTRKNAQDGPKSARKGSVPSTKKRKLVLESDSDFEVNEADTEEDDADVVLDDSDDEKPRKGKPSKQVVNIDSDEEEEVIAPPKKRHAASTPSRRSIPASLAEQPKKASQSAPASKPKRTSKPAKAEDNLSQSAVKAVAAVAAVVSKLPSNEALIDSGKVTKMQEGAAWGAGGAEKEPPNHGSNDYPRGHPDCLCKYTIVVSGVLDSMMRQDAVDFVKRHGGRVTSGVSSKTSFLLCGKDTGNSKWNEAQKRDTKLLVEEGLLDMVRASTPFIEEDTGAEPMEDIQVVGGAGAAPKAAHTSTARASTGATRARAAPARPPAAAAGGELWVDKWKPKNENELVGNPQGQKLIAQFLTDWENVHLHGQAPRPAPGAGSQKKDMSKKAILICGPPGIGKTTAAHIISQKCGFEIVEVNASDTRNKSDAKLKDGINGKLSNRIKELVNNTSLYTPGAQKRRQVLVMDEVDGMSGGDRGGVTDLIASIKVSKMPIVCVCNDKYKQSMRTLRNHCIEVDWRKPTKQQVAGRLQAIARAEGLAINTAVIDALVESSQGDIRMMLGQLQMHRLRASSLTYDQVKASAQKDMDKSPFDCARKLLSIESCSMTMGDRMDCVFQDMDLVPLLVQENYINHRPNIANNEVTAMQVLAKAADAFSDGDVINRRVRMKQEWNLMPAAAMLGTVYPASYMRGQREPLYPGEMNFPRFTSWLGNFSSSNKQKRIAGELTTKLQAAGVVCDRRDLRLQYLPTLRATLTDPLVRKGAEGIDAVIDMMQLYLISRDDLETILDITKFKTQAAWGKDPMKDVETKVKSAFTRTFNKSGLPVKTTIMVEDGKKSKGGKRAAAQEPADSEIGGEVAEATALNAKDDDDAEDGLTEEQLKQLKGVKFQSAALKGKGKVRGCSSSAAGRSKASAGRGSAAARGRGRGRGRGK
eukprot:jgi/Ulvmu1/8017/UM004_0254.1